MSAAVTPGSVALPGSMDSTRAHMASVSTVLSGFTCHSARLACAAVLAVVEAKGASIRTNRNLIVNGLTIDRLLETLRDFLPDVKAHASVMESATHAIMVSMPRSISARQGKTTFYS